MSKKYKGKQCTYCTARPAATADHIFARGFFLESNRADLPKAPACSECNRHKSDLEHYLQPVFAFGGQHQDASRNLNLSARRKLNKDVRLFRQLAAGYTGTSVPIDWERVEELFHLIARGLIWYHWQIYLDDGTHSINVKAMTADNVQVIDQLLAQAQPARRVSKNLGNHTFDYEGAQTHDDPQTTIWKFSIYGGLVIVEGDSTSSIFGVWTKPIV